MKLSKLEAPKETVLDCDIDFPERGSRVKMIAMQSWTGLIGHQSWADASEEDDAFLETESTTDNSSSRSSAESALWNNTSLETSRDLVAAIDRRKLWNRALKREERLAESSGTSSHSTSSDYAVQQSVKRTTSTSVGDASSESYFSATDGGHSESGCSYVSGKLDEVTHELEEIQLKGNPSGNVETHSSSQRGPDYDLGDLPSEGSRGHATSSCKPCMFIHSPIGCFKGVSCSFCHLSHDVNGMKRYRPCKSKRERYRNLINVTKQRMREREDDGQASQLEELPDVVAQ